MRFYEKEAYVFVVLGPAFFLGSLAWLVATRRFRQTAARAAGVVVGNEPGGGRYGTSYSPVFRFMVPDGREFTVESSVTTKPAVFRVGQAVTVLYRPAEPQKARIDSVSQLWLLPASGVVAGAVFSFLAWWQLHSR